MQPLLVAGLTLALTHGGYAMTDSEIPMAAPKDAVMAPAAEVAQMEAWIRNVFLGEAPPEPAGQVPLRLLRQDHNVLRFGQSCMETPIRIGSQSYAHGLGTHANSVISVTAPAGARSFEAQVGIDVNPDTAGTRGTVVFSVEVDGVEVFRTDVRRGGQEPVAVSVPVPEGGCELILKVDTTDDGPACDQADWADARLVMADGTTRWLDENRWDRLQQPGPVPFSFVYGDKPSAELLPGWDRTVETRQLEGKTERTVTWADPATGLAVIAVVTTFADYPAADWVLYFENRGTADTPALRDVWALDTTARTGNSKRAAVVHSLNGDICNEQTFLPIRTALEVGKTLHAAPDGGRPSNGRWPFYNLEYNDEGLLTAIGWSGQWASDLQRAPSGLTRLVAGMERTNLFLRPGERIRTPRILVLAWKGDRLAAHNRFRRLLMFHYVPQLDGRPARLPLVSQCFDRYSWSVPEWATEQGQLHAVEATALMGCDAHWLDAAWFPGGFPNGVGNWSAKPAEFANGLGPVGQACKAAGLKFVLWYEPERVAPGTEIAVEHPEFVMGGANGGLFKLNDPEARRWLTERLSSQISDWGITFYRNDFNIDPLGFWRANDEPGREGMTEIRYVEGHYEMWDELRARHPGLLIDNCASGGRRIDLETISRSVPLWRSDTSCSPGHPDWNQSQSYGLSLYIPLHTACGWTPEPYDFRSSATGGAISQFDYRNPAFDMALAQATFAEARANQKYWYGDFYPLTPCSLTPDHWIAYQFHRADLDEGLVLAFRRPESVYPAIAISLQGLRSEGRYAVEFIGDDRQPVTREMTGAELAGEYELRLAKKGSSMLIRYRPAG